MTMDMGAARAFETQGDGGASGATQPAPRILVVDDVADNRDILTRRLVRRGFEVTEAVGGVDALEKIHQHAFDVVLLDIMMPDINGNEVLRKARETFTDTELPIVMVTAKSQSEDVVESLKIGANDYITKPVDFAVALARINSQIERKRLVEAKLASTRTLEEKTTLLDRQIEEKNEALNQEAAKRQVSEDKLRFLAYHDSLTGLLNRQGFRDCLHQTLEDFPVSDKEPALIFIDLNAFKAVNDTHGHQVGDKLLQAVGQRLSEVVGPDTPLARLGGDEFAAIVSHRDQPAFAMQVANRIVERFTSAFDVDGKQLSVGASCGVARASQFSTDLDGLVKAADLAMYHAKAAGTGGAVLFETRMLQEQEDRRRLETDLRYAIQHYQFEVFYQPLVDMKTRDIVSFEALLRWPHQTRGMISPEIFIPLAEETGLITQLGAWALRQACEEAVTWPEHISIAVNLSPIQFKSPSLLPTLINVLATTGLSPKRLELEITETALLGTENNNVKILEAIRQLGVRVSMDDFGTGYSSLAYLQSFEFDKIKIDKRFTQSLAMSTSNSAIVDAIIKLGTQIGIATTAEGIETEEQFRSVESHGCTQGQGYLFSRPLTAKDTRSFIEATRAATRG